MAFDVSINIKATPQLQGTQAAEAAIEKIGATAKRVNTEAAQLPSRIQPIGPAVQQTTTKVQGLSSAVAIVGTQLGGLGAGTSIAANALTSLVTQGLNPVSLVMTAVGLGLGLLISKFNEASDAAKKLEETQIKAVESARKTSDVIRAIEAQGRLLDSAEPELEGIKQKYAQQIKLAQDAGVGERSLGELRRQQAIEEDQFRAKRFDAFVKEEQQRQKELADLDQKIAKLQQEAALKRIDTGRQGVSQFEQQFGVQFGATRDKAGADLATSFVTTYNEKIKDPANAQQLNQAFASFVQQAVAMGLPDVQELLLKQGLSSNALESLKSGLGNLGFGDLVNQLQSSAQAGEQWGATFLAAQKKNTEEAARIGEALDKWKARLDEITNSVATAIAPRMDVSEALTEVERLRAGLNAIPDVTVKQVVMQTYYAASPARPFSEFLPFMDKTFSQLQQMVPSLTPDVVFNVPNLRERMAQIESLQRSVGENIGVFGHSTRSTDLNFRAFQNLRQNMVASKSEQIRELQEGIQFDLLAAQSRAGTASGASGGGAGVTVNLDLRNATLSREFLDNEMIPALERGIIRSTGQDPEFRVLN